MSRRPRSFVSGRKRADLRTRVLDQALGLDSFVTGLLDPTSGAWVDAKIRWQDVGSHVREWRERVDGLSSGAAEIGDRSLTRLVVELELWKRPIAEVLRTPVNPAELELEAPSGSRRVTVVIDEIVERLRTLTRRARRQEFWIAPAVVIAAGAIAGLIARL